MCVCVCVCVCVGVEEGGVERRRWELGKGLQEDDRKPTQPPIDDVSDQLDARQRCALTAETSTGKGRNSSLPSALLRPQCSDSLQDSH